MPAGLKKFVIKASIIAAIHTSALLFYYALGGGNLGCHNWVSIRVLAAGAVLALKALAGGNGMGNWSIDLPCRNL
jgi:hypothetical protein